MEYKIFKPALLYSYLSNNKKIRISKKKIELLTNNYSNVIILYKYFLVKTNRFIFQCKYKFKFKKIY